MSSEAIWPCAWCHRRHDGRCPVERGERPDGARPADWFPGAVEVENSGVYVALGTTSANTIVWHWCDGLNRWDGARITNHTIVSRDPLTITASLACTDCTWHGFITDGRWRDA